MPQETNVHPEIAEVDWIDDAFYIKETRYGLFTSVKKMVIIFLLVQHMMVF